MPPFVPRKRHGSHSPAPSPAKSRITARPDASRRTKPSLFDTVDAPGHNKASIEKNKAFLASLEHDTGQSSPSEVESDDFEDVLPSKRRKVSPKPKDEEDEGEDEMDWEDAIAEPSAANTGPAPTADDHEIADVSISMNDDGTYVEPTVSLALGKKGPSKRERQVRIYTHELHVQALMWHNTIRNSWINDKEVQQVLVDGLPPGVKREVTRWKENMGMLSKEELLEKKQAAAKGKNRRGKPPKDTRGQRDWHVDAEHLEHGVPNLSGGDPLLRLLKILTSYWRKRFAVTAPGLRKQGYKPLRRLRDEIRAWDKNHHDPEEYGERVQSLQAFRKLAKSCEGSRDVGGQLFTALLRGLGLEARMVANLQPAGIGWSKTEEADAKRPKSGRNAADPDSEPDAGVTSAELTSRKRSGKTPAAKAKGEKPARKSARGNEAEPISLEASDSALSSPPSAAEENDADDDDLSIIDVTPSTQRKQGKKFDRDMAFPHYWTEVLSPVSNTYIPVDPIVLSTIASNAELLQTFEPRGKRADKAKQVMCYTVAHNADGSAKDVTVRYLKKHQLPGKTKGVRMPVEKIAVYNHKGKVKRYEEYNWFRTVMSGYERSTVKRTAADDLEEATDLKPFQSAAEKPKPETESLQWYKQSAEFVLEDHLRREEAILPGAEPLKTFKAGKGDKAKEHPVYLRSDAVVCKTVESWHKEGRAIIVGAQPRKYVPMRAVTLIRKREMEDAQRETGEKLKQALYSVEQTDWIIPPPIANGVIPKNAFGNMDVYVPTMVPQGAVHIPLRGTPKVCRKLDIDYAEACTGFEFGKQRAVPVLTGVVVAEENEGVVREAWCEMERERRRKEDGKRTAVALAMWRKMVMGMRILERMRIEYAGNDGEVVNPFVNRAKREKKTITENVDLSDDEDADETGGGGFFPPGYDEEEVPQRIIHSSAQINGLGYTGTGGGFLVDDDDTKFSQYAGSSKVLTKADETGGGYFPEEDNATLKISAGVPKARKDRMPITPVSLQLMHKHTDGENDSDADEDGEVEDKDGEVGDEDGEVEDEVGEVEDEGPRSGVRVAAAPPSNGGKSKGAARRRNTVLGSHRAKTGWQTETSDEGSDGASFASELSDLASGTQVADAPDPGSESHSPNAPQRPWRTLNPSSPCVVIPPPETAGHASARPSTKQTLLKSRYFPIDGGDEDEESEESEIEVIRPRKTTARTRSRA